MCEFARELLLRDDDAPRRANTAMFLLALQIEMLLRTALRNQRRARSCGTTNALRQRQENCWQTVLARWRRAGCCRAGTRWLQRPLRFDDANCSCATNMAPKPWHRDHARVRKLLADCSCAMTRRREGRTPQQSRYPAIRKIIGGQLLRDDQAPGVTNLGQTR